MDTAYRGPGAVEGLGTALKEEKATQKGSQHIGSAALVSECVSVASRAGKMDLNQDRADWDSAWLCSWDVKKLFTFRDASDDETHQARQQQDNSLGFLPPKPLQQENARQSSW